ncbi:hypothetical protein BD779DRAFT_1565240, partial [Infundibulicybe gibba]
LLTIPSTQTQVYCFPTTPSGTCALGHASTQPPPTTSNPVTRSHCTRHCRRHAPGASSPRAIRVALI